MSNLFVRHVLTVNSSWQTCHVLWISVLLQISLMQGVLSGAIPWRLLQEQYFNDSSYQDEIAQLVHSPEEVSVWFTSGTVVRIHLCMHLYLRAGANDLHNCMLFELLVLTSMRNTVLKARLIEPHLSHAGPPSASDRYCCIYCSSW